MVREVVVFEVFVMDVLVKVVLVRVELVVLLTSWATLTKSKHGES